MAAERGPAHALAPELVLRPVLTELGATVPGRGLFVVETELDDRRAYTAWMTAPAPIIQAHLGYRG